MDFVLSFITRIYFWLNYMFVPLPFLFQCFAKKYFPWRSYYSSRYCDPSTPTINMVVVYIYCKKYLTGVPCINLHVSKRCVFIRMYLQSLEYEIWCAHFRMTSSMEGNSIYDCKVLGLHTAKQYSILFRRQEVAGRCVSC